MNSSFGPLFHPYVASSAYMSASGRQSRFASHCLLVSIQRCHIWSSSSRGYAGTSVLLDRQRVRRAVADGGPHFVGKLGRWCRVENAHLVALTKDEDLRRFDRALCMSLAQVVVGGELHDPARGR